MGERQVMAGVSLTICKDCGLPCRVLETRTLNDGSRSRRYKCPKGHMLRSYEIFASPEQDKNQGGFYDVRNLKKRLAKETIEELLARSK